MRKQRLVLKVVPTKRSFLSVEEAKRKKNKVMEVIAAGTAIRAQAASILMRFDRNLVKN